MTLSVRKQNKTARIQGQVAPAQPKRLGFDLKAMQSLVMHCQHGRWLLASLWHSRLFQFPFFFLFGVQLAAAAANLRQLPNSFPFAHVGKNAVGQILQQQNQLCSYTVGEGDYFSFLTELQNL